MTLSLPAVSQTWEPLGDGVPYQVRFMYSDTVDNYLYAAGLFMDTTYDGRVIKGIARWDGVKWDSLGRGIDGVDSMSLNHTFGIVRYHNKLYVGGYFASLGNVSAYGLGTWDGSAWDSLPVQPFNTNASTGVHAMTVADDAVYFGGTWDTITGIACRGIAKWNDTVITPICSPSNLTGAVYVFAICEFNGYIYVGGNFSTPLFPFDTIQDIMRYDGTNWSTVGGGMKGSSIISSIVVYNNELYVAGTFYTSGGNAGNCIQRWDGNSWSDVGGGTNVIIQDMHVFQNKLYVVGGFTMAGGIPAQYVASWDGTDWCALPGNFDNGIEKCCVYRDSLCVGGGFWTIDGDSMNYISKWIGGTSVDTCGNMSVGINETDLNSQSLNIFPNPATNQITIEFELAETKNVCLEIKNVLGQTIKIISNSFTTGNNKIDIDVSEFSSGLYFIQLQSKNKIISKKMIKE